MFPAFPKKGAMIPGIRESPDAMPLPDSDPNTPVKPKGKKHRAEMSLHELQKHIVGIISAKINERADNLESMINHNTVSIDALKNSIDFAFAKFDSLKTDMKVVKTTTEKNEQKLSELELKLNDAERYQRRWNLRLHGILEEKQEDIKAKVINICCSMVPNAHAKIREDIDIVHQL
ncbi:unnamed protein product [Boreogadus saida]